MADLILGPQASTAYLRAAAAEYVPWPRACSRTLLGPTVAGIRDVPYDCMDLIDLAGGHIDVLSSNRQANRKTCQVKTVICPNEIPRGSLLRVDKHTYICSPEMCCLLVTRFREPFALLELMMEFLGLYSLNENAERGFDQIPQRMTMTSISRFAERAAGFYGVNTLKKSLLAVAERSASPRETSVYLCYTLGRDEGGYCLPKPELNKVIKFEEGDYLTSGLTHYVADLIWEKKKLIVEYDGKDHEDNSDQSKAPWERDKERRSDLAALGYRVIVLSNDDVTNPKRCHDKAAQVANGLGVELPDGEGMRNVQGHLQNYLFDTLHHRKSRTLQSVPCLSGDKS